MFLREEVTEGGNSRSSKIEQVQCSWRRPVWLAWGVWGREEGGSQEVREGVEVGELGPRWCRALQATAKNGSYFESVGAITEV